MLIWPLPLLSVLQRYQQPNCQGADLVMLSIRLGTVSWALAAFMPTISATQINSGFISSPFTGASFE
jgi:hypothetical protein